MKHGSQVYKSPIKAQETKAIAKPAPRETYKFGFTGWKEMPPIPEYVFVIHEKMKADMMERSGVPISNPRTNYRLTGFKG